MNQALPSNQQDVLLLQAPLLRRLPKDDLLALAEHASLKAYSTRQTVFSQGDPGDALHVIVSGAVRIVLNVPSGGQRMVAILGKGDCFGELAILDGRPRSASAVAAEPTVLMTVSRGDMRQWLSSRPASALALLETLSLRLRSANDSLVEMAFSDVEHRLARLLLRLASEGSSTADELPVLEITQSELAAHLTVTRESINKQLRLFGRRGWLKVTRGKIVVLDAGALRLLDQAS